MSLRDHTVEVIKTERILYQEDNMVRRSLSLRDFRFRKKTHMIIHLFAGSEAEILYTAQKDLCAGTAIAHRPVFRLIDDT